MNNYKVYLEEDYRRRSIHKWGYIGLYLRLLRMGHGARTPLGRALCKIGLFPYSMLLGLEIPLSVSIGKGLNLCHAHNITLNEGVTIGEYCTIYKGVTIGKEFRGRRKGCPSIGNRVWIGTNSVVVGNIRIGDDVLIAPNCLVNTDVPSHSIVIGNPCRIMQRANATEAYI